MEAAILGLVLDSSVLIAAERKRLTTPQAIRNVCESAGEVPIVICSLTVAELGHGIYRADTPERGRMRRQFLDEIKAHLPIHPVTEVTAEIVARRRRAAAKRHHPAARRSHYRSLRAGARLLHRNKQCPGFQPYSRVIEL
jgi:predicted nucleic acid-binding protein